MEYKPGFKNIIYMFIKSHKITLMRVNYNLDILPKYFYANAQNATNLTHLLPNNKSRGYDTLYFKST